MQFEKEALNELSEIGASDEEETKDNCDLISKNDGNSKTDSEDYEDYEDEVYKTFLILKHEKNGPWVQLRKGCLDLFGMPVNFTAQAVKNTSRAFARNHKE